MSDEKKILDDMAAEEMEFQPCASLGRLIRIHRDKMGISRAKLAEFAEISPNSMAKYEKAGESGGKYPSLPNMAKIAKVLRIDPRWILEMVQRSGDAGKSKFSFYFEFAKTLEYLDWQMSIKSLSDLNYRDDMISMELHSLDKRFERIEHALGIKTVPSIPADMDKVIAERDDYHAGVQKFLDDQHKQNDPNHEGSGHSEKSTSEPEAVDATSSNKPKKSEG